MVATEPGTGNAFAGDEARIVSNVLALLGSHGYVACGALRTAPPAILVVEEGCDAAGAGAELLRSDGYDALGADGYAAAVAAATGRPFDLLLTHLDLIGGGGCALLAELRGLYDIDGIAVSERGTAEEVRRARGAGFLFHLTKPLTARAVGQVVEHAMARRSLRRTSAAAAGAAVVGVGPAPAPR